MKKLKLTKENVALTFIIMLSGILNLFNLGIEGYANLYYASGVKSMTMNLKNFFFVSFDPAGFVSIDKPPVGFWLQAISAKIFGYHGWSIILPQAIAGILSVFVIYKLVKRSFGSLSGLLSALFLSVTPVFVAVSRNNTIDNVLVFILLLAAYALTVAAENGKTKYLLLSMVLIGVGFNVKMLQAYMIVPAIYLTYLLSSNISIKKRIINLVVGTIILAGVSLSWAFVVDRVPAASRPYVDSSTNNTVMELIIGHNGAERLGLSTSSKSSGMPSGGNMAQSNQAIKTTGSTKAVKSSGVDGNSGATTNTTKSSSTQSSSSIVKADGNSGATDKSGSKNQMNSNSNGNNLGAPPSGRTGNNPGAPPNEGNSSGNFGGPRGNGPGMGDGDGGFNGKGGQRPSGGSFGNRGGNGSSGLSGSFGAETKAGLTRLFSKNSLSDQIVWFIPLAFLGFITAAIREKLRFKLDNNRKRALVLWFMWLLPVFVYFSFNTGLFHSYYLTMLAPPAAALAGIGISSMWDSYKERGLKSWFLPIALIINAGVQLLEVSYFYSTSNLVKVLGLAIIVLSVIPSLLLIILNIIKLRRGEKQGDIEKTSIIKLKKALVAIIIAGLVVAPLTGSGTVLSKAVSGSFPAAGLELLSSGQQMGGSSSSLSNTNDGLVNYLVKHKTTEKYLLVVSSINTAEGIILKTGESVMSLGGFMGSDNILTLKQFKELVKKGEVRYVLVDGMGRGDSNEITQWAASAGKLVAASQYSSSTTGTQSSDSRGPNGNSGQLYDLKAYTTSNSSK